MSDSNTKRTPSLVIVILFVLGLLFVALALAADFLGIDLTPGFGVIQVVALGSVIQPLRERYRKVPG
jgi:hypothetical protein